MIRFTIYGLITTKLRHNRINHISRLLMEPMSGSKGVITVPDCVRGMTELDKNLFNKTISVPFIEINFNNMEKAMKYVKPFLLKFSNFNSIQTDFENDNMRQILLNPEKVSNVSDIINGNIVCKEIIEDLCQIKELKYKDIELNYDNFNHNSIIDGVLPSDEESVTGYSIIGHILHLNLRDHALPYKKLIGHVLLDKVKHAKMVVNKLDSINSEFRNFQMEVLAKSEEDINTVVKVKESDVLFEFDFADVYWNPRLGTEHERIVNKLHKKVDILYDVFAGVGPFAIPAAKHRHCQVIANDLNPECYKWLKHNSKLNKVENLVKTYNMDGRDFITQVVREDLLDRMRNFDGSELNRKYHIVMNLPALAVQFLDAFTGLLCTGDEIIEHKIYPLVHCYCFLKEEQQFGENKDKMDLKTKEKLVRQLAEQNLGNEIIKIEEIVDIRKVAPNKTMFRISFLIPEHILYQNTNQFKKQRIQ